MSFEKKYDNFYEKTIESVKDKLNTTIEELDGLKSEKDAERALKLASIKLNNEKIESLENDLNAHEKQMRLLNKEIRGIEKIIRQVAEPYRAQIKIIEDRQAPIKKIIKHINII